MVRQERAQQISVTFENDAIEVDATIIAKGMGVHPQQVLEQMRSGTISARCERGVHEDDGRYRLTFLSRSRRLQLIVENSGKILQRNAIDFGKLSLPQKLRSTTE